MGIAIYSTLSTDRARYHRPHWGQMDEYEPIDIVAVQWIQMAQVTPMSVV